MAFEIAFETAGRVGRSVPSESLGAVWKGLKAMWEAGEGQDKTTKNENIGEFPDMWWSHRLLSPAGQRPNIGKTITPLFKKKTFFDASLHPNNRVCPAFSRLVHQSVGG